MPFKKALVSVIFLNAFRKGNCVNYLLNGFQKGDCVYYFAECFSKKANVSIILLNAFEIYSFCQMPFVKPRFPYLCSKV